MFLTKEEIEQILNKEKISFNEIKEITKYAIEEEKKKDDFNFSFNLFSYGEYYKSSFFKKRMKLQKKNIKFNTLTRPFTCNGFCNYSEIFVFSTNHSKVFYLNQNNQLIELLQTSFHEYSHYHQNKKPLDYSLYIHFFILIESFIHINTDNHNWYNKHWNILINELISDLNGIRKTKNFLKEFPKYYAKNKNNIENNIKFYELGLTSYSFNIIFKEFHRIISNNKQNYSFDDTVNYFYNPNSNKFKSITEIIKQNKYPFIYFKILTTDLFIEQLDFLSLELPELTIMKIAIITTLKEEKEKKESIKNYLKEKNPTFLKIKLLYKLKPILVEQPNRIKLLEETLTKLNKLIENKNIKYRKKIN